MAGEGRYQLLFLARLECLMGSCVDFGDSERIQRPSFTYWSAE
jgi:hypothetical protein